MLKLSRNAVGVLNSQYRSILKKCLWLNMLAAGMLVFVPNARADGEYYDSNSATALDKIKNMGTVISPTKPIGGIFLNNPSSGTDYLTKQEYSTDAGSDVAAWLRNQGGQIGVGYTYSSGTIGNAPGTTIVSNKNNMQTENWEVPNTGGAIVNLNLIGGSNDGGVLNVRNSKFLNNSTTYFYYSSTSSVVDDGFSGGGAIANASREPVTITGTTFESNFAMDYFRAAGGAIYNGPVYTSSTDSVAIGDITSSNNQFIGNHVGNEKTGSTLIDGQWSANTVNNNARTQITIGGVTGGISDTARGGALVNEGGYTSIDSTFKNNYAFGKVAQGGAIYNAANDVYAATYPSDYSVNDVLIFFNGSDTFTGNYAKSNESYNLNGDAMGGAIYNNATIIVAPNGKQTFSSNYAVSQKNSLGGAIYNGVDGMINNIRANTVFNGNYARNEYTTGNAKGGAIANLGVIAFDDAIFTSNYVSGATSLGGAIYNNNILTATKISTFTSNTATGIDEASGGAIYNDTAGIISRITGSTFKGNKATVTGNTGSAKGGAIANYGTQLDLGSAVFDGNVAKGSKISDNSYASLGGAIYNEELATINIAPSANLTFKNNEAYKGMGGAIYNEGTITTSNFTGSLNFSGNVAPDAENDAQGGAIYNTDTATINIELKAGSGASITFAKAGDTLFNEGIIAIAGNNATPTLNVNNLLSGTANTVKINSTVDGTGTYDIRNSKMEIGSTGYVKYDPKMVLVNNRIHLSEGAKVYLNSAQENASNGYTNNFYTIDKGADLYYRNDGVTNGPVATQIINKGTVHYLENASNSGSAIEVATAMKNSGILDVASEGVLTNVHIDNLISEKGNQILVNMDNPNLKADVLHVQNKIANDTNIVFKNMAGKDIGTVYLEEDERILFAETSQEDASFITNANVNARKRGYMIDVNGYDEGSIWRWYLERGADIRNRLAMINLPRSAIEQLRSLPLNATRTNRGQCSCYSDNCNNAYCQYENSRAKSRLWATPLFRKGEFKKPFETDFTIKGIDFGYDFQPTHHDMFGIFGSYRDGNYETKGKSKKFITDDAKSELDITSILGGLYYRRYVGDLYMLGAAYAGKLDVDMKASNPGTKASVDGFVIGAQAELGYDIHTSKRSTFTPSLRATYNYINFDKAKDDYGQKYSFEDTHNFELEAAIKYEYQFNNEYQLPTTGYIKPSVIQTLNTDGKVKITDDFGVQEPKTLDNETLGRIEIGGDTEIIPNFSIGAFGNYTFGTDYKAWGVGGNIRYIW